jgi:hypothetical protein
MRSAPAARAVGLLALGAVAAGYFALGCRLTLEWADEGHVILQSWRVAEGAVPYRDTLHPYGPSIFFVNGLLFRLFGPQLLGVRVSLVVAKAALAVLVYLSARQLASRPFALAVYAFFVVLWGAPMWIFNAPYASHYSLIAVLGGLLVLLRLHERHPLAGCALAGVSFGVGATFKQTSGLFASTAFLLYVLYVPLPETAPRRAAEGRAAARIARLMRIGALIGALGLCVAYLRPNATVWDWFVLFTPVGLAGGYLLARELRDGSEAAMRIRSVAGMICCGVGMIIPLAGYATWYGRQGLIRELIFNTVSGLPQLMKWFVPVPVPDTESLACLAMLLAAFALVRQWRSGALEGGRRNRAALVAGAAVLLLGALLLARAAARAGGIATWASSGAWQGDVLRLYFFMPFLAVWISLRFLVSQPRGASVDAPPAPAWTSQRRALALYTASAATGLLYLYPAGDFWHVIMTVPLFLPLLAYQLERFHRVDRGDSAASAAGHSLSAAFLIAVIGLMTLPPALSLVRTKSALSGTRPGFARAAGIVAMTPEYEDAAALVGYLDAERPASRQLLIIPNQPMLYFLAGRVPVQEKDEFVLYLVGAGLINDDEARRLAPEQTLIERLTAEHPIIVDDDGSPSRENFRRVFARVTTYVDAHYRPVRSFGRYRVLDWAPE